MEIRRTIDDGQSELVEIRALVHRFGDGESVGSTLGSELVGSNGNGFVAIWNAIDSGSDEARLSTTTISTDTSFMRTVFP